MNFSPCCGAKAFKENQDVFVCTKCGTKHYINPKGAAGLLLKDSSGKLVLARRAHEPNKGSLDCIGGFLDAGENFEQALYRELFEETGLKPGDISELRYAGSTYDDYPWPGGDVPIATAYYMATLKLGAKLVANDDIASIEHREPNTIKADECSCDGMREILVKNELVNFEFQRKHEDHPASRLA